MAVGLRNDAADLAVVLRHHDRISTRVVRCQVQYWTVYVPWALTLFKRSCHAHALRVWCTSHGNSRESLRVFLDTSLHSWRWPSHRWRRKHLCALGYSAIISAFPIFGSNKITYWHYSDGVIDSEFNIIIILSLRNIVRLSMYYYSDWLSGFFFLSWALMDCETETEHV